MIRRASIVAGLVAALAHGLAAQDTSSLLPGDRDASAELARIVEAARGAGLPVDPIIAKVRYGAFVAHASPARIVAAARAVASRLESAREALAPGATQSDIAAGADALGSGATKDALKAVRAISKNQPVAIPLGVLAELLENHVPPERAAVIVTELIKRGASDHQLVALGNNVRDDVQKGAEALVALDTRVRGLTAVLAPPGSGSTVGPTATAAGPKKP